LSIAGLLAMFAVLLGPVAHSADPIPRTDPSKRIGIVYSEASAGRFYDRLAYSSLFMAMQHQAMMAGVPFDLLTEDSLTQAENLVNYDALIFPSFTFVTRSKVAAIEAALTQAVKVQKIGILAAGNFMTGDEAGLDIGTDKYIRMKNLLGVRKIQSFTATPIALGVETASHPAMRGYTPGEVIYQSDRSYLSIHEPVDSQTATILTKLSIAGGVYNGVIALNTTARNIHFPNEELLGNINLAWSAIQWMVYGDQPPIALKVGRHKSLFVGRNDVDQSKYHNEVERVENQLLGFLKDWKSRFNFVSSYYINIGNDPAQGHYTDWNLSRPIYQAFQALGNEIGTHSYTHPNSTSALNATQLEFEFNQSKIEIGNQLGVPVVGAAVPGNPENAAVDAELSKYLSYTTGRYGNIGFGYPGSFGFLTPGDPMFYFSPNMLPDFTMVQQRGYTARRAESTWRDQYFEALKHASQPIVHWHWHDYAPTILTNIGYDLQMFENTVALAAGDQAEFATAADVQNRVRSLRAAKLRVTPSGTDAYQISTEGSGLGTFTVSLTSSQVIQNVGNWYAFSDREVFLPESGGAFSVQLGSSASPATRITSLPMRARLVSVSGDGVNLSFTFDGEGVVQVLVHNPNSLQVGTSGSDGATLNGNLLTLQFNQNGRHQASVSISNNHPPVANALSVNVTEGSSTSVTLTGSDLDSDPLTFRVVSNPSKGTLSGSTPNLTYSPTAGFVGIDSFQVLANDGQSDSALTTITISIIPINHPPVAHPQSASTLQGISRSVTLSGSDPDGQPISYSIVSNPAHGSLSGTPPELVYTPAANYTGEDLFSFKVHDGELDSAVQSISITVIPSGTPPRLSNPVVGHTVDGLLSDWTALLSFGIDPDDTVAPGDQLDWIEAWMGHDESNFFLAYKNEGPVNFNSAYNLFLDTDTQASTGYAYGAIGADYFIQDARVYQYTGDGSSWSWINLGRATSAISGSAVELSFPRTWIGNPTNIDLFFMGDNSAYVGGSIDDRYPDNATGTSVGIRFFKYATALARNTPPLAQAQSISTGQDQPTSVILAGTDADGDPLTYRIQSNPTHGSITGSAPNLTYTPAPGYSGADSLSFIANDGKDDSAPGTITLNVVATVAGSKITNPVSSIIIDGQLSDWAGTLAFPGDPVDSGGGANLIDWLSCSMAHDVSNIYLAYRNAGPITLNWAYNTYIDTDSNPTTGFLKGGLGVEYLVQGRVLYRYTGDGSSWSWATAGQLTSAISGNNMELAIPRASLGNPGSMNLFFIGENKAYTGGTVRDAYPDAALTSGSGTSFFEYTTLSTLNSPPVASSTSLTTRQGFPVSFRLPASDPDGDPISFQILTPPTHGALTGSGADRTYTPESGYVGSDSFTFLVNDGKVDSASTSVSIQITAGGSAAKISNLAQGIIIDGQLSEWSAFTSFPTDPIDATASGDRLDWLSCSLAHDGDKFYLSYRTTGSIILNWGYNAYVDSDTNPSTGYRTGGLGADYLIQGTSVYRYAGDGSSWSWTFVGSMSSAVSGASAEFSFPRSWIGNPSTFDLFLLGENAAFTGGTTHDAYPDNALGNSSGPRSFQYTTVATGNQAPAAASASVSTRKDTPLTVVLSASDPDADPIQYIVITSPEHGTLSGSAPNLTYTPSAGYSGPDSFTFKASDGLLDSPVASISITVTTTDPSAKPSNPVTGITIDGLLSDWSSTTSFGADPADAPGSSNLLDWLSASLAHDTANFYLAYQNKGPITLNWAYSVYVDTDSSSATGFAYGSLGVEYLLQGSSVYHYTGDGSSWSWAFIGSMTAAINGNNAELAFPQTWIGSPSQFRLYFLGENAAFPGGTTVDAYPDNAFDEATGARFFEYTTAP